MKIVKIVLIALLLAGIFSLPLSAAIQNLTLPAGEYKPNDDGCIDIKGFCLNRDRNPPTSEDSVINVKNIEVHLKGQDQPITGNQIHKFVKASYTDGYGVNFKKIDERVVKVVVKPGNHIGPDETIKYQEMTLKLLENYTKLSMSKNEVQDCIWYAQRGIGSHQLKLDEMINTSERNQKMEKIVNSLGGQIGSMDREKQFYQHFKQCFGQNFIEQIKPSFKCNVYLLDKPNTLAINCYQNANKQGVITIIADDLTRFYRLDCVDNRFYYCDFLSEFREEIDISQDNFLKVLDKNQQLLFSYKMDKNGCLFVLGDQKISVPLLHNIIRQNWQALRNFQTAHPQSVVITAADKDQYFIPKTMQLVSPKDIPASILTDSIDTAYLDRQLLEDQRWDQKSQGKYPKRIWIVENDGKTLTATLSKSNMPLLTMEKDQLILKGGTPGGTRNNGDGGDPPFRFVNIELPKYFLYRLPCQNYTALAQFENTQNGDVILCSDPDSILEGSREAAKLTVTFDPTIGRSWFAVAKNIYDPQCMLLLQDGQSPWERWKNAAEKGLFQNKNLVLGYYSREEQFRFANEANNHGVRSVLAPRKPVHPMSYLLATIMMLDPKNLPEQSRFSLIAHSLSYQEALWQHCHDKAQEVLQGIDAINDPPAKIAYLRNNFGPATANLFIKGPTVVADKINQAKKSLQSDREKYSLLLQN